MAGRESPIHHEPSRALRLDGTDVRRLEEGAQRPLCGDRVFLGEVAMIAELPYSLTAIARGPLTAARIDRDLFMRVATEYPEFGAAVFRSLSQKLDGTVADLSGVQEAFNRARSFSGR